MMVVLASRAVVVSVAVAACGRIQFVPLSGDANGGDGITSDGPSMLSCVNLAPICGPAGTSPCCDSPLVPGGTFYRGYDLASDGMFTDMAHPATVSTFRLDRYEVTLGRFRQFVMAGQGTQQTPPAPGAGAHPNIANSGWDATWNASLAADTTAQVAGLKCDFTWTDTPGAHERWPVTCITWFEAMAFCAWDGGFLPTEAEWHYAASGGNAQRAYPWSNPPGDLTIDCAHANDTGCAGDVFAVGTTSPAGDGMWGQAELAGNALEWVFDWDDAYASPCDDCVGVAVSGSRVARGGATWDTTDHARTGSRYHAGAPTDRAGGVGTRCARSP
jgi:formylglycine-generating enzyme required for sulfatase activity